MKEGCRRVGRIVNEQVRVQGRVSRDAGIKDEKKKDKIKINKKNFFKKK